MKGSHFRERLASMLHAIEFADIWRSISQVADGENQRVLLRRLLRDAVPDARARRVRHRCCHHHAAMSRYDTARTRGPTKIPMRPNATRPPITPANTSKKG